MATNTPFILSAASQESIINYYRACVELAAGQFNFRERLRQIDLVYLREMDQSTAHARAKQANRNGDPNKFQNITVPVIKPQVEAAVGYQAAVFLTEYPIFGVAAEPAWIKEAKQMQALMEENSNKVGWTRELLLFFMDGFRYNISAIECCWGKKVTAALETDLSFKQGKEGKPVDVIWEGNVLERWDMYNTFWDYRCQPHKVPEDGEFVGNIQLKSRTALKTLINSLPQKMNVREAFASQSGFVGTGGGAWGGFGYYQPILNPDLLINSVDAANENWMGWLNLGGQVKEGEVMNYKGSYEVTKLYLRIIPSEHGIRVPSPNTPQIWKFYIINHQVIIFAELQTNAHEKIPVFFGCPGEDGLGYQSKSFADDAEPFQSVATAMMNSIIQGRRRAIMDRIIYDPSRISEAHINSPNPIARIPVRPNAYGKPLNEAVYAFPYRDDQAGINMQEITAVVQFANVLNGQNAARQGQFVKGNKTDGQWDTVMQNATSKDQRTSLLYEVQVFTPLKEVLKLNYMQYQAGVSLYSQGMDQAIKVDPVALRAAVINFKVTDGLLPKEKVIKTPVLQSAMQVIGTSQAIGNAYNIGPLFSYIMETENVDLAPFEKTPPQIAYEQALSMWQSLAQLALQKGTQFQAPQPKPAEYNYDPNAINPATQKQVPSQQPQLPNQFSGAPGGQG